MLDTISNALLGLFHGGRGVHHLGVEHALKGDGFGQIADDAVEVGDELLLLVSFLIFIVGLDGLVDWLHCLDDEIGHFSDLGLKLVIRSHHELLDLNAAVGDAVLDGVQLSPVGAGVGDVIVGINESFVLRGHGADALNEFVLIPVDVPDSGNGLLVLDNKAQFFTHAYFPFQSV